MEEFLNLIEEFRTTVFNVNVFVGIVAAVLVFIVEISFIRSRKKRNRRAERAAALGHVVMAKRIEVWDDDPTGANVNSWIHATYVYEVNGKNYQYKYMERAAAPITMKLYYIDNPRRVFSGKEKENGLLSILWYVFPIAVAIIVINLLGGI